MGLFLFWTVMLFSRGVLSALLGANIVINTVQQQNIARDMALALTHDPNGILCVLWYPSCGAKKKRPRWRSRRKLRR